MSDHSRLIRPLLFALSVAVASNSLCRLKEFSLPFTIRLKSRLLLLGSREPCVWMGQPQDSTFEKEVVVE